MSNLNLHSAKMRMGAIGSALPWDGRVTVKIWMDSGGFFAAHYHRRESTTVPADCEIYEMVSGFPSGVLRIFLRDPAEKRWKETSLSISTRWVLIPPGWHHAGLVVGDHPVVFNAHTRVNHTKPGEEGGNVIWFPDDDQPKDLIQPIRMLRKTGL